MLLPSRLKFPQLVLLYAFHFEVSIALQFPIFSLCVCPNNCFIIDAKSKCLKPVVEVFRFNQFLECTKTFSESTPILDVRKILLFTLQETDIHDKAN